MNLPEKQKREPIRVVLFGACDRYNYGDLLLPILMKRRLQEHFQEDIAEVELFGTVQSDLSHFGALPTQPLRLLYKKLKTTPSFVVMTGGDMLTLNWSTVYSYLEGERSILWKMTRWQRKLNIVASKIVLHGKGYRPFIFPASHRGVKGVIYNSVGGRRYGNYPKKDIRFLQKAVYLSSRDLEAYKILNDKIPHVCLAPDSAIQVSRVFPKKDLWKKIRPEWAEHSEKPYLLFQVSLNVAEETSIETLASLLRNIYTKTGWDIWLCPIGTAPGHDDHLALQQIKEHLPEDHVRMATNPTIWEIMFLIAHARLYLGGSLHGVITSMSHEVPYLFLGNRPKLRSYVETWGLPELCGDTNISNWEQKLEGALSVTSQTLHVSAQNQISISEKSFEAIFEILRKG